MLVQDGSKKMHATPPQGLVFGKREQHSLLGAHMRACCTLCYSQLGNSMRHGTTTSRTDVIEATTHRPTRTYPLIDERNVQHHKKFKEFQDPSDRASPKGCYENDYLALKIRLLSNFLDPII
uniref:Uncharacterized protein n=1 Tax=Ascaris lumbricoides TaxID=6252 RepID=A0A0M3I4F5_ASCLU